MRWQGLFEDLEAQASALAQAARAAEVRDQIRGEFASVLLFDRMRAALGALVRVRVTGLGTVTGRLTRCGPDWLLIDEGDGQETLVATRWLLTVRGLGRYSAPPPGPVEARLGLRHVLRGVARDRSRVQVRLVDELLITGTLDRVGADFVELAAHSDGESRRRREVRDVEIVSLHAIIAVRRSIR
ncbi:MAG TPA: hypothetical protein VKB75_10760 [Jatrophihabitans sp.]|nr:hypothetical protein [Jatrophihabitans sp.]